jgi:NAD(P)-dependent dehydrogenase (short-subunit alcohol dehydrogenase family)
MARTVIVTGASRGIGKATAQTFVAQGDNVVLTSRKQDALDKVAEDLLAAHPSAGVLAYAAHAAEPDQAAACVEAAMARFGSVDVLVNNAGGPVLWSQLVWKVWMSEHGGAIVNVASLGGLHTELGIGYYNATKAALIHLTRQLAMEMAPSVRVNGVAPGIVRTHLAKALWENHEEQLRAGLPLGRIGEPDDIADVIVFLAGDGARWMTGQTLVVDGGAQVRSSVG